MCPEKTEMSPGKVILYNGPHRVLPVLSSAVRIVHDESRGRHMVASCDIPVGAVLLRERAFAVTLRRNALCKHLCHECCRFIRDKTSIVYCTDCNDQHIPFCCLKCYERAKRTFHKFQCGFHQPNEKPTNKSNEFARLIRVVSGLSAQELLDCDPAAADYDMQLGKLGANDGQGYKTQDYRSMMSLVGHFKIPADSMSHHESNVKEALHHLIENGYFEDRVTGLDPGSNRALLERHLRVIIPKYASNNFALLSMSAMKDEEHMDHTKARHYPNALYTVASLVNHSCQRNLYHIFDGDVIQFHVVRPIMAGEELNTNYGAYFGLYETRVERRLHLGSDYDFHCECGACTDTSTCNRLEIESYGLRCDNCLDGASCLDNKLYRQIERKFTDLSTIADCSPTMSDLLDLLNATLELKTTCCKCGRRRTWSEFELQSIRKSADQAQEYEYRALTTKREHLVVLYQKAVKHFAPYSRTMHQIREKLIELSMTEKIDDEMTRKCIQEMHETVTHYFGDEPTVEHELIQRMHLKYNHTFLDPESDEFMAQFKGWYALACTLYGKKATFEHLRITVGLTLAEQLICFCD